MGFRTDAELARFFGISRSAVSQWPRDFPIPALRQYILHQRYPNLFPATQATQPEQA
nr:MULTISPECIES: Cro/CI family transcriptional regulator [Stenotrophomonas]